MTSIQQHLLGREDSPRKRSGSRLNQTVNQIINQNRVSKSLKRGQEETFKSRTDRKTYLQDYGAEIKMPTTYLSMMKFYAPDSKYIVAFMKENFPQQEKSSIIDFKKLGANNFNSEEIYDEEYSQAQIRKSKCSHFKVYLKDESSALQVAERAAAPEYLANCSFADNFKMIALVRQSQEEFHGQRYVVLDLFKTESIDFFTQRQDQEINTQDPDFIGSIHCKELTSLEPNKLKIRFSKSNKYLYINKQNTHLLVYDLADFENQEIRENTYYLQIPEETSFIVNIAINEEDIDLSLVACKKKDFRTMMIMPVSYIEDLNQKISKKQRNIDKVRNQELIKSIRYSSYNTASLMVKFSENLKKILFSTDQDFFIKDLETGRQTVLHFCKGKRIRKIFAYDQEEFVVATANDQDKYITFSHSDGNPLHSIKMTNRFDVGLVSFQDFIEEEIVSENGIKDISMIIVRDEEEFMIMTYRDFNKQVFWARILETSNYVFEWPYIVYVRNQKHIYIHSIYEEDKIYVIKGDNLAEKEFISHLYTTYTYEIFYVIDTGHSYKLFQVNTQNIIKRLIHDVKCQSKALRETFYSEQTIKDYIMVSDEEREKSFTEPIFEVEKQKGYLDNLYRIIVRPSCRFEAIANNNENMVFFISNFKLFHISENGVKEIDTSYKYKQFQKSLGTFRPVDENKLELNKIKMLHIDFSDFRTQTIYDSNDEKIIEYQVDDPYFIILSQSYKGPVLRLHKWMQTQLELVNQLSIDQPNFIAVAQICSQVCNGMFLKGNHMYHLDYTHKNMKINHYEQVLPLDKEGGEIMQFNSPYFSKDDRKIVYLTKNPDKKTARKAYVMNYPTDSFNQVNSRESSFTQYSFFIEYKDEKKNRWKVDTLTLTPYKKVFLQYSMFGKLRKIIYLDQLFSVFGDKILSTDDKGRSFALSREEDCGVRFISKISIVTNENKALRQKTCNLQKRILAQSTSTVAVADKMGDYLAAKVDEIIAKEEDDSFLEDIEDAEQEFRGVRNTLLSPRQREDKKILSSQIDISVTGQQNEEEGLINFKHIFTIDLNEVEIHHEKYPRISTVLELLEHFKNSQFKKTSFIMNDLGDILMAIGNGKTKIEQILEVILIKQSNPTKGYFLTPEKQEKPKESQQSQEENPLLDFFKSAGLEREETTLYEGFQLTKDKVLLWTQTKIYQGNTEQVDSVLYQINLKKVAFGLEDESEGTIEAITSKGQTVSDKSEGNYYVIIKVLFPTYSFVMKYNLIKEKEYNSFDCSTECQVVYDHDKEAYILEKDQIISVNQGLPLLFFQDGLDNYNPSYFMHSLDRGYCFSQDKEHFVCKNKIVFSFSYLSLLTLNQNKGKTLNKDNFSISAYNFRIDGQTILHRTFSDYNQLKMMLQCFKDEESDFGNLLLLQDYNGKNALDLACEQGSQKVINLILDYLSQIKLNNINLVRKQMFQLIEYDSFDNFMELCFFQTVEMANKTLYNPKTIGDSLYISSFPTCFMDENFDNKFKDPNSKTRPVKIKAIDAGWVFKSEEGMEFLQTLGETEKMQVFLIPSVKYLIIYQWTKIYPVIRNRLFMPFLAIFLTIHFYFIYAYEWQIYVRRSNKEKEPVQVVIEGFDIFMIVLKILLIIGILQQNYIEYQQIKLHRAKYFTNFWNVFDICSIILLTLIVIADFAEEDPLKVRPLMAVTFLLFYFRMFYYLRIFDTTAPLVKAIIEIAYDSISFLLIFTIGVCGFAFAFWTLSNNNVLQGKDFIDSLSDALTYSYLLSLGEFGLDDFEESTNFALIWIIFILASIFSLIILLNMLIAIMGESFARVQENSESHFLREHLQLIIENEFLYNRKRMFGKVKYMIAIIDDQEAVQEDAWLEKVEQVMSRYGEKMEQVREMQHKQESKVDQIQSMQEKMKEEMFKMRELIEKKLQ